MEPVGRADPPVPVRAAEPEPRQERDRQSGIGYLSVQARQWGAVFLDGSQIALETPVIKYKVPAGTHEVYVCFAGDRSQKSGVKRVTISRGETTLVRF